MNLDRLPLDPATLRVLGREVAAFIPDVVHMLRGVATDDRVPHEAKLEAAAALAYVVSPFDRIIDWIPVIGKLDDVAVVAFAVRRLLLAAGEPVLRDHWRGGERGFRLLLDVVAALATPRGLLRRAALAGGLVRIVREARSRGGGPVIDGEVLDRR
jgi:uncharacterized membrane protein YkvA (DUF1232 family)